MTDLISSYFTRDLGEAEESELAALLQASPEEALRFARLAAADYARLGLGVSGSSTLRRASAALGLAALTAASYVYFSPLPERPRPSLQSSSSVMETAPAIASGGTASNSTAVQPAKGESATQGSRLLVSRASSGKGFAFRLEPARLGSSAAVFDAGGRRVAKLKTTGASRWAWDADAGPGRYELRVDSGDGELSAWVEIEKRVR